MEPMIHSPHTLTNVVLCVVFLLLILQELANGFHDVANAVATVIYSRALKPLHAVLMAGACNFAGVLMGGTAVAFGMLYLMPKEMIVGINTMGEAALFLAMIISAVGWNVTTWWYGIPNSTTHSYVGAIIGVSMAHAFLHGQVVADQINWVQGEKILMTLLISPVIGLVLGIFILFLMRLWIRDPDMYCPAGSDTSPPVWVKGTLIAGAAGVSLLHGSNDGQKTIGILMLVMFGLFPAVYGLNPERLNHGEFTHLVRIVEGVEAVSQHLSHSPHYAVRAELDVTRAKSIVDLLHKPETGQSLSDEESLKVRMEILNIYESIGKTLKESDKEGKLLPEDERQLHDARDYLADFIEYVPFWVILLSASVLGGGTLIGYSKIVTTLGEKMGSSRMNPAQGTAAQLSAVISIALADLGHVPASTTHVLSSAVVGTVMATPGQTINQKTISSILITWVTTLPVTALLAFSFSIVFYAALA